MPGVAAVIIGTDDEQFRHEGANGDRLELARRIAAFTRESAKVDVVVLPAGFLAVREPAKVRAAAESLAEIFAGQVLLAGVDEEDGQEKGEKTPRIDKDDDASENANGYHYWAFASANGKLIEDLWWQRSAFSGQVVSDTTARYVQVGKTRIGILICGELFNPSLAESLAKEQPDLVVDLAHRSMTRVTKSLTRVAKTTKCPVLHAQHVAINGWNASKWQATPQWDAWNDRGFDWASYNHEDGSKHGSLWAEVKIWQI